MSGALPGLAIGLVWLLAWPTTAWCGWRTFTPRDGLAGNELTAMLEDRSGSLWFAAGRNGVSRYDGVNWRTFTAADGLGEGIVWSAMEDRAGNLWFGTETGASRYNRLSWRTYTTADGLPSNNVRAILQDRTGSIWFGTGGGLARYDGSTWELFTAIDGLANNSVTSLAEDRFGNLWVGTVSGLSRYNGMSWYTTFTGQWVNSVMADRAGNVWAGLPELGAGFWDGLTWRTFSTADGLVHNYVWSTFEDKAGDIWLGTLDGVSRYNGSTWYTYTTADGLAYDSVRSILEDEGGNIWFGTVGAGVSRYDRSGWRAFTTVDGLVSTTVSSAVVDHAGDLWVVGSGGASRFDGSTWRSYTMNDGLAGDTLTGIVEDHASNLWFTSRFRGVSRFDGSTWQTFTTADGLARNTMIKPIVDRNGNVWLFTAIGQVSRYDGSVWQTFTRDSGLVGQGLNGPLADRAGNVWYGTANGLNRYDGLTWSAFTTADGLPDNYVTSTLEDHVGNIWIGTTSGVSRYDGSSWLNFTTQGVAAQTIVEDRAGNLWFGTGYNGVFRFDGSTWQSFTNADGLAENNVRTGLMDGGGNLWFGTAGGVSRFDGSAWRSFSTADGLADNYIDFMLEDHSGNLWVGTSSSISRYEPDRNPPRTLIRTPPPRLSASRSSSARFAAFAETEGIEFSYRLDGGAWSVWSPSDTWFETGLTDGIHTLEVRARDYLSNVDSTAAEAAFEIDGTPPLPVIASPAFGQAVRGTALIHGTASDARFTSYRIEVRRAGAASWNPPDATILMVSAISVTDGALASWNTSGLADGNYELRLTVFDQLGLVGTDIVRVMVDNEFPFMDQTSPATVSSSAGGDLYTTNQELHFYFPPNAFDDDALVSITETAATDTLPSGAVRVLPAYDVAWSALMRKPATLEFSTAGRTAVPGALVIYTSPDGVIWQRLGGTAEEGKVSLTVRDPGHFALFAEETPVEGEATLSALSFTPRVFSLSDRFANDHVAIGFTLGRSTPVTVRIYNRAGRLVREVVSSQLMGAGGNLVRWDGRDRGDVIVADGLYLVTVEAWGETKRSTIAVVR
jgi:ligand-binding sensor domain-containing protein